MEYAVKIDGHFCVWKEFARPPISYEYHENGNDWIFRNERDSTVKDNNSFYIFLQC